LIWCGLSCRPRATWTISALLSSTFTKTLWSACSTTSSKDRWAGANLGTQLFRETGLSHQDIISGNEVWVKFVKVKFYHWSHLRCKNCTRSKKYNQEKTRNSLLVFLFSLFAFALFFSKKSLHWFLWDWTSDTSVICCIFRFKSIWNLFYCIGYQLPY
jgi:hypothetical protein